MFNRATNTIALFSDVEGSTQWQELDAANDWSPIGDLRPLNEWSEGLPEDWDSLDATFDAYRKTEAFYALRGGEYIKLKGDDMQERRERYPRHLT